MNENLAAIRLNMEQVAREAGEILSKYYGKLTEVQIESKAAHDFVSIADKEVETFCVERLHELYPSFDYLGEEGFQTNTHAEYRWIVDPLDGTTNFLRGLPVFGVSIGLEHCTVKSDKESKFGELVAGVVYNPISESLWSAAKGLGASWNGKPIHTNQDRPFSEAIFATGFPFRVKQYTEIYIEAWRKMFLAGSSMRRCGAASIDLCWVAQGVLDGYWEMNLSPWDMAAGIVIVREAGGLVSSFALGEDPLEQGCIWASAAPIHSQGVDILKSVFPPDFAPKGVLSS